MRKFALETAKDLKDLIRKLSIGLTNLAKDVDTLEKESAASTDASAIATNTANIAANGTSITTNTANIASLTGGSAYVGALVEVSYKYYSGASSPYGYANRQPLEWESVLHDTEGDIIDIPNNKLIISQEGYWKVYGEIGFQANYYQGYVYVSINGGDPVQVHVSNYNSSNDRQKVEFQEIIYAEEDDYIMCHISAMDTSVRIPNVNVDSNELPLNLIGIQYIGT